MARASSAVRQHHGRWLPAFAIILLGLFAPAAAAREAFVANGTHEVVAFDTATNQVVGSEIPVGLGPFGIAITPDARTAYVTNIDIGLVKAIDVQTRQVVGQPIMVGGGPEGVAITPDGSRAYVATNGGDQIALIDTGTNFVGPAIQVGDEPTTVAITPDGRTAYATNWGSGDVSVIDLAANQVVGSPIPVGSNPRGIAITPDGSRAYVANQGSKSVSVIDTAANQLLGSAIPVGGNPRAVAITPDGSRAYVANEESGSVSVIDTATNQVVGSAIVVGGFPKGVTITPDGSRAYVAKGASGNVSVIDTATNQVVGSPITIGDSPQAIAITPDQAPVASFTNSAARPGVAVTLDGSASRDTDGSITRFEWDFGGEQAVSAGPTAAHTFAKPGRYPVTLTVTDDEGCSTSLRFTGQTAYCNGSASARLTRALVVAYPAVRIRCPKRAGKGGCRFKITALTKRRRGRAMTGTARGKAKAGKSTLVSLKPKPRFAARLAAARRVLVRETVRERGAARKRLVRLPISPPPG